VPDQAEQLPKIKVFEKKILSAGGRMEIFFTKPAGLDLAFLVAVETIFT